MGTVRGFLSRGNGKVGQAVHLWGIPAGDTCPGMTPSCEKVCYAKQGRFRLPAVAERLVWNLAQSRMPDFSARMAAEVRQKGCLVVRVHSAGDFYDADYAGKWEWVLKRCPKVRFYFYTRSWRDAGIRPAVERIAGLANVRAWYSADADTGPPPDVPAGVRVAFLQVREADSGGHADLVFRVRRLRSGRLPLGLVCPHETPRGLADGTNCGNCQHCWK